MNKTKQIASFFMINLILSSSQCVEIKNEQEYSDNTNDRDRLAQFPKIQNNALNEKSDDQLLDDKINRSLA